MSLTEFKDIDAEMAVIGCVLFDNNSIIKVIDDLEPADFYDTNHQIIYSSTIECFAKSIKIDIVTLADHLNKNGDLEKVGGQYYLAKLDSAVPSAEGISSHAKIIIEHSKRRQLYVILQKEKSISLVDPIDDKILKIQESLIKLTNKHDNFDVDFREEINNADELLKKRIEDKEKKIVGYEWSCQELTRLTGGIEPPFIYVFGGLKKTGKSKFLFDQIHSLVKQNIPSLCLELEMGKSVTTRWLWSRFAEVDSMKIRYPLDENKKEAFSADERGRLWDAKETIENLNESLIMNTKSFLDFNQIKAKVYQSIQQLGIRVVFLDHLQRCNFGQNHGKNDAKVIEEFVFRLADMMKDFDVALIMLSQLSNVAENKLATIKDLKHSGGIGEGVDFIGIMNRKSRIKKEWKNSNIVYLDCWQRDGGEGRIHLNADLTIGKYTDAKEDAPF